MKNIKCQGIGLTEAETYCGNILKLLLETLKNIAKVATYSPTKTTPIKIWFWNM